MTALSIVQAPEIRARLPMTQGARDRGVTPAQWRVLVEQVYPAAKTAEAVELAIDYCVARRLDVYKKPVHIVPMWSAAKKDYVETLWPGINEVQITAARTNAWAGMDSPKWGPMITRTFTGQKIEWPNGRKTYVNASVEVTFPEWCEVPIYRLVGGQPRVFCEPVYWIEAYSRAGGKDSELPTDMWVKRPRGQLHKTAKAASLRAAFPEEGELTAEEMEGKVIEDSGSVIEHEPVKTTVTVIAPPADEPESPIDAPYIAEFEADVAKMLEGIETLDALDDLWVGSGRIKAEVLKIGKVDKEARNRIVAAFTQKHAEISECLEADAEAGETPDDAPGNDAPEVEERTRPAPSAKEDAITTATRAMQADEPAQAKAALPPPTAINVPTDAEGNPNWKAFSTAAKAELERATDNDCGDEWLSDWRKANNANLNKLRAVSKPAADFIDGMYTQRLNHFISLRDEAKAEAERKFPSIPVPYDGNEPDWLKFADLLKGYLDSTESHRVAAVWWPKHAMQMKNLRDADPQAADAVEQVLFRKFPQLAAK